MCREEHSHSGCTVSESLFRSSENFQPSPKDHDVPMNYSPNAIPLGRRIGTLFPDLASHRV
jgi:hypothetical protein